MPEDRFTQPEGFAWDYFRDAQSGARIRYGYVASPEPVETIVIVGGFCEPAEKYFEVIRERLARGAAVWIMDWRGQGGSDRFLPDEPEKSHHTGFGAAVATLRQFVREVVKPVQDKPVSLIAHSMGAHIALRALHAEPGLFDRVVLTDPMMVFKTKPVPLVLARLLAIVGGALRMGTRYVPGGGKWSPGREPFEGNQKTSDPARFGVQRGLFSENPALRCGSATFGWVREGFRSCDFLNGEGVLKSITTPILMQVSGGNDIVSRKAALRAAEFLPHCTRVDIPEAKHEIWMERDALRDRWLAAVDGFLGPAPGPAA